MSYRGPKTSNLDPVINYISNGRAYDSTIGWATYADAAGAQPVDGTGGSPNVTWSRDTTTPLRQGADFNFVKDAVNRQGQGVSYDFTIDNADLAKVLTVTFDYEVLSGTYATGDLTVYLIQDPSGTPTVVQPAGYQIQSATVGTKMRQIATFQTASNVTSYRLCLHVASVSASAYSLAVDNVVVGPQVVQYGAPVTDWQAYTPNLSNWGSVTNVSAFYRRVGDSIEVTGRFTSGTVTGTNSIGLPTGLTLDTAKINVSNTATLGTLTRATTTLTIYPNTSIGVWAITYNSTVGATAVVPSNQVQTTGTIHYVPASGFANSGDSISFEFRVPISGWSSSVQMSNDTDTRVVDMQVNQATSITPTGTIGTNFATSGTINFNKTPVKDSHGAYSAGVYTVPVAGDYFVAARLEMGHTSGTGSFVGMSIAVNGSEKVTQAVKPGSTNAYPFVSGLVTGLVAGDQITIRLYSDSTSKTLPASVVNDFTVHRLSGPSAIAASESVNAKFRASTGQSIPNGAVTLVNWDTKDFDSHGAVTTGVGTWRFTAPISGKYRISGYVSFTAVAVSQSSRLAISLFKNNTLNIAMGMRRFDGTYTANMETTFTGLISLVAGDYIDVRFDSGMPTTTMSTGSDVNWIGIERIGN